MSPCALDESDSFSFVLTTAPILPISMISIVLLYVIGLIAIPIAAGLALFMFWSGKEKPQSASNVAVEFLEKIFFRCRRIDTLFIEDVRRKEFDIILERIGTAKIGGFVVRPSWEVNKSDFQ